MLQYFFKVDPLDKNKGVFNQIFCHGKKLSSNSSTPQIFLYSRSQMGVYSKKHCLAMAIVIRIFLSWSRNPKWSCYSSYITFSTFTKLQGCKQPIKMKNVTIFGKFKIFLEQLKDSTQSKQLCEYIQCQT